MLKRTAAFAAILLLVSGSALAAQDAAPHSGFWLSGGLGAGLTDDDSVGDDSVGAGASQQELELPG